MSESSADNPSARGVSAEDSPVPAGPATLPRGARPWQEPNRLVLRAAFGCGPLPLLIFSILFSTAVEVQLAKFWGLVRWTALAFILFLPALCIAWFCWRWYCQSILPRVTFDKETGLLTLGRGGRRGQRPLSSVIGVQVMHTRKQSVATPAVNLPKYQLNLILDDCAERRLNVMTSDLRTARSNAQLIADFLGVPVLDSTNMPADAAEANAAEVKRMTAELTTVPALVVTQLGPDVLLIRPRWFAFLGSPAHSCAMALGLLAVALIGQGVEEYTVLIAAGLGCVGLVVIYKWLRNNLDRRTCFDRARGVLTLGWRGRQALWPLSSVQAVEVEAGPWHNLYLLLDDPQQPRLNIIPNADAALVGRTAERVASFLGVPLRGAKPPTPAAAQPGEGEKAVKPLELLSRTSLPAGRASIRGPARVVPKGEDVLLLQRRSRFTKARLVPTLIAFGAGLYLVWLEWFGPAAGQGGLGHWKWRLMFLLLAGPAVLKTLLLSRDHFDRQTGLLTLGWFGLNGTYPLAKVRGVQLVPGGLVDKGGGERVSYQLNLVMADSYEDRLNLTDDSGLQWTRQAGQQIADFLGVPVIDQIADGD